MAKKITLIKIVKNGQGNQDLNKQIKSIVQQLKKDLLKLQSDLNKKPN